MILYLTAGLFGGYNETIKFEELGISTHSLTRRLTTSGWLAAFCSLFQLTASQGGWQGRYRSIQTNMVFQLTASQGGWRYIQSLLVLDSHFNSQPHKEADSVSIKPCAHFVRFQLTASQGGWLIKSVIAVSNTYFNSQPHKEADLSLLNCLNRSNISTHSLTRRLTSRYLTGGGTVHISTHSLTRRLTIINGHFLDYVHISTHSLTRRLTMWWL